MMVAVRISITNAMEWSRCVMIAISIMVTIGMAWIRCVMVAVRYRQRSGGGGNNARKSRNDLNGRGDQGTHAVKGAAMNGEKLS